MNRLTIYILSLFLLSSCSNLNTNNIAPGYRDAFTSVNNYFFGSEDNLTSEIIKNIPYASATLKIGRGPKGLVILESINSDKFHWISADGIIIVTDIYGRIHATSGLINNLEGIETTVENLKDVNSEINYTSYYTFSPPRLNLLPVNSIFSSSISKDEELLSGTKSLLMIEERVVSKEIGWKRTNQYHIDKDGFIWRSKQYVTPKLPPFYFEITKKPAF